jgi:uncharacterized protein YdaT
MKLEHQHHQQHEVGITTSTARSWNNNIINTKLEQQHQQHEAGTSTAWSWNNSINNTKLEHQHQQHGARTTTSICGNKMRQVHQQQYLGYSDKPSLPNLRDLPKNHKIP